MKLSNSMLVRARICADLFQAQLARQDDPLDAHLFQESHPFWRMVVHLRAGEKRQRRQVQLQQPGVLDDQRVRARLVQFARHVFREGDFFIEEQGVERNVYPRPILMRVVYQRLDIIQAVSGGLASAELARANIHRVCSAVDRRLACFQVFGRG